jgi:hypothetical protein
MPHLRKTEELFRQALRELDPEADCTITPAADLCLPHDVIRLAGGFATGCLVQWDCDVPVVPVDTTVNIDTSSIFWLDEFPEFDGEQFDQLRQDIEQRSSYEWNFHKGNHFIALCKRRSDGAPALVIHSNEKEFKYQYNGLMPVDGNWFMSDVSVFRTGNRYLRLLIGKKAELFAEISALMEPYNVVRHRFIASELLSGRAGILHDEHHHHYNMPTPQSVAIGCFIAEPGDVRPIFSRAGSDISMFQVASGGANSVLVDGIEKLLVPHGWGKTVKDRLSIAYDEQILTLNDVTFENRPLSSIGKHPDLVVREFDESPGAPRSLFSLMEHHTPGAVIDSLQQLASYTKDGFHVHSDL